MKSNILLLASGVLNIALLSALVVYRMGAAEPKVAVDLGGADGPQDPARVFEWATTTGSSASLAYRFALVAAQPRAGTAPDAYWKPQSSDVQPRNSAQQLRNQLLQSFGPEARERPEYAEVFKPYAARFPFLSSEKQLALQEIFARTDDTMNGASPSAGCTSPACTDEVRKLLNDEEFFEYQLRDSPLADQLVRFGFDFTETEFREVYRVLADASKKSGSERDQLERILGKERFVGFQRAQDPVYQAMLQGASHRGIGRDAVDAAYDVVKSSERRLLALKPADDLVLRESIHAERDQRLQSKLGTELFQMVSRYLEPHRSSVNDKQSALLVSPMRSGRSFGSASRVNQK